MNPFYFGTARRRLFGIYEPAAIDQPKSRAALLCHSWGAEYVNAHRSMRRLASMLTAAGIHVLRFDYFGTGDSSGESVEADLKGWEEDIATAIEELKDTTGVARVSLIGLRVGAALAARVAAKRRKEIDALVLWDPVVSGADYVQELHRLSRQLLKSAPVERPGTAGGGHEILGFPLTADMAEGLRAIDLAALVSAWPAQTRLIASQSLPSHEALRPILTGREAGPLSIDYVADLPAWIDHTEANAGAVPVRVLQRIVQWLT
jgi:exosortase A-associated hydrolase 2